VREAGGGGGGGGLGIVALSFWRGRCVQIKVINVVGVGDVVQAGNKREKIDYVMNLLS
jgi:hypothetical protein